jgi:chromosome partitioning protein
MSAKKVSIINMKGGVGKTTLSINLALFLSERMKKRVLLIDLDPQANATIVGIDEKNLIEFLKNKKSIADLFINCFKKYGPFPKENKDEIEVNDFIYRSYESYDKSSYLDIIPSELNLSSILKGVHVGPFELKNRIIQKVEKEYDYIIIDCAPTYSILTTLALNATKAVLIPVMADSFAIYGVKLKKQILEEHKEDYGVDVKVIGLVFSMWNTREPVNQTTFSNKIIREWGLSTFRTKIRATDWYKIANGKRKYIWDTRTRWDVKDEFERFVGEYINKACYLFSWDAIRTNNVLLIKVLMQNFDVDWISKSQIEKSGDGNVVKIFNKNNTLSLILNNEKTKVDLIINDSKIDEFNAKIKNGMLNIYKLD